MSFFITGVAGFIGSHIAEELLKSGEKVVGVDNFYSGTRANIDFLENINGADKNFVFYPIDIRDSDRLEDIFKRYQISYVFHLGAIASVQKSIDDPVFSNSVNVVGTLNILELSKKFNIKRVVFSSSAAVYGDEPNLPKNELSKTSPISPYGYEKLIGEYYMNIYNKLYGIETVSLRYFNVYGERQDPSSEYSGVISIFEDKIKKGKTVNIYGDGLQYRDFVYVKDVAKINISAMLKDDVAGEIFAVGTGETTTILQLFYIIRDKYNQKDLEPNFIKARNGDIRESRSDNSKIVNKLAFNNFTKFSNGIMNL